jgi:hypothetical protein
MIEITDDKHLEFQRDQLLLRAIEPTKKEPDQ